MMMIYSKGMIMAALNKTKNPPCVESFNFLPQHTKRHARDYSWLTKTSIKLDNDNKQLYLTLVTFFSLF